MSEYQKEIQFINSFLDKSCIVTADILDDRDFQQIQKSDKTPVTIADVSIQMLFNDEMNLVMKYILYLVTKNPI